MVVTTFLGLKEFLVCLPSWQASHNLVISNFILGNPLTRSFLTSFDIKSMLACPSLLCHSQLISFSLASFAIRHWLKCDMLLRSTIYTLPCLFPTNTIPLSIGLVMIHMLVSKQTFNPMSHSWLMLIRLCFRPLTKSTLSMKVEGEIWTLPIPMILP